MTGITIGTLKKLIKHIPDDFEVRVVDEKELPVHDKMEVDLGLEKVIFKAY